jgi:hypothetical protein
MAGKGSKRRRTSDQKKYNDGWDNIFGKPDKKKVPVEDNNE